MEEKKSSTASIDEKRVGTPSDDFDFGGDSTLPPPPTLTPEQQKKLWRKVDLRIMPILALMYLLSYMDRGAPSIISLDVLILVDLMRYAIPSPKETSVSLGRV